MSTTRLSPGTSRAPAKTKSRRAYETLSVGSVGIEMGISVFIGWGIGYFLDRELGTGPYLMTLFLLVGAAAGFNAMFRVARQAKAIAEESNE